MLFKRRNDPRVTEALSPEDVERAYERGVHDERRRHRSHPILALVLVAAAAVGVGGVYLAAHEGSFARGGQVVDQKLASATGSERAAGQGAVDR